VASSKIANAGLEGSSNTTKGAGLGSDFTAGVGAKDAPPSFTDNHKTLLKNRCTKQYQRTKVVELGSICIFSAGIAVPSHNLLEGLLSIHSWRWARELLIN
jgi:hypothetical protein